MIGFFIGFHGVFPGAYSNGVDLLDLLPYFQTNLEKTNTAAGERGKYRQETTDLMYSQWNKKRFPASLPLKTGLTQRELEFCQQFFVGF